MEVTFAMLGILVGNNGLVCVEASFQFYPGEHLRERKVLDGNTRLLWAEQ